MITSHKNEVVVCYLNPSFVKDQPKFHGSFSLEAFTEIIILRKVTKILRKVAIIKLFKTVSLIETSQLICSANILNLKML